MLCIPYRIETSGIAGAGKGLFAASLVPSGRVIAAPTHITETVPLREIIHTPDHPHADSSIRWFEEHCTISPDWPDECYVNHSFQPNGVWHLGFIFALREIRPGEEITVDYRFLIGPDVQMPWLDAQTQQPIIGFSWEENLLKSSELVLRLARKARKQALASSAKSSTEQLAASCS